MPMFGLFWGLCWDRFVTGLGLVLRAAAVQANIVAAGYGK